MQTLQIRFENALTSLDGLSVGDAFGQGFFINSQLLEQLITERALPSPPWFFTDDTLMTLSIVSNLRQFGTINQDALARSFAERYDYERAYGPSMHRALGRIRDGEDWRDVAGSLFAGQGSFGNGAAMRVAPLGAFFADDFPELIEQARLSAEVTHAHPEAIAGAIAVAVAAGVAVCARKQAVKPMVGEFFAEILSCTPSSEVKSKLARAQTMPGSTDIAHVAAMLGNGTGVSAQDTVPFAVWCAAQWLDDFETAMWKTVSALGDRDTTCAIVGGIVASFTGREGIPSNWLADREPLPDWFRSAAA